MVREVEPDEVRALVEGEDDVEVVDIRSRGDYAQGHVPGAISVPLPELPQRVEVHDWDADEVVCVCAIGESSVQAARLLASYEEIDADDVASMAGGYREWDGDLEEGRPSASGASDASEADEGPQAPF